MAHPHDPVNPVGRDTVRSAALGDRPGTRRDREESKVVVRGILIALVLSIAIWGGLAATAYAFSQAVISVID